MRHVRFLRWHCLCARPCEPSFAVAQSHLPQCCKRPLLRHRNRAGQTIRPVPSDNLVVSGIPPVPLRVVERVGRYTEFRTAGFFRLASSPSRTAHPDALCRCSAGASSRHAGRRAHPAYVLSRSRVPRQLRAHQRRLLLFEKMSAAGNGSRFSVSIWEPVRSRCSPTEKAATWEWSGIRRKRNCLRPPVVPAKTWICG